MTEHPADTVRAVVDVLADEVSTSPHDLARIAGEVLDAIVEDPVATRHADGTVTLQWPTTAGHAALVSRDLLELLVVDANRVRAGSEPYPAEPVELTAGQWWGMLLDLDPEFRRKALDDVRDAAIAGGACWMLRHDERIATDAARLAQLEPEVATMRRTLEALRGPLAPLVDRTPTEDRAEHLRDAVRAVEVRPTPTGVLTVPAGTTDEDLDRIRATQPPTVEVRRPYVVDDCTGRKGCPAPAHLRGCHSVTEVSP